MQKPRNVEEVLPVWAVEQDTILSGNGDLTIGYACTLPPLFSLSNADYEAFHQSWVKAIKGLPGGTVVHKQDWFVEEKLHLVDGNAGTGFLTQSSNRYFHERPFLAHTCYVFFTRKPKDRVASTSVRSNLLRRHLVPGQALNPEALQLFTDRVDQAVRILEAGGFVEARRLRTAAFKSSPEAAGIIERYCYLLEGPEKIIRDIVYTPRIRVGLKELRMFTLANAADLPGLCGPRTNSDRYSTDRTKFPVGFAAGLGQLLHCNHIYNQYLFLEDPQVTIRELERRKLRLQSLSAYSRSNALARDAVNEFLQEAVGEQRTPLKAHFNILAWTESLEGITDMTNLVTTALAQMDAVPKQELDGAPQIHWAGIPGNAADFPMHETFDTFAEQACCLLNLESADRSAPGPLGLRLGERLSGYPLLVDLSDVPMQKGIITNRNKFILGPSGSGKSFFTNHLVRSYYAQGTHIVLVDVGHSYRGLCDLVGGYYFTYTENRPIRFNPFYLPPGEVMDTEKKESIKTLLLALWKKENETFRRSEYVALSNALQLYVEKLRQEPSLFPCFNSFYEFLKSDFLPVLARDQVKEKDFDVANFLYVLRPFYVGGEFDYLLNATEHLDVLQQRFIVFELDNIKDHPILFPVVTLIIMEVFISKMRKLKGVRKMILIEEAWKAIAKEGMAEYIKYLFKTVRKFFGEAVVVTQEVEDIISSPIVKQAIINNSDCKILLDQSKYQNKFGLIQELLGLTEKEKTQVLSINKANDPALKYKEVFISLGGTWSRVYRVEVSPEEYLAYTTEETEKMRVQEYAQKYGSMEQGIKVLAREMRDGH